MKYPLHAIFPSLQGEGRNSGRPCTFIRFSSCNLACQWCDTHKNVTMEPMLIDILRKVDKYGNRSVVITGGEPTIQPGLDELVHALKKEGYWLALETNGLERPDCIDAFDYVSVSPKSDYTHRYLPDRMLRRANEVRIVAVTDLIAAFCRRMRELIAADDYYISPLDEKKKIHYGRAMKLQRQLNMASPAPNPPWALSIQVHKVLGIR